MKAIRNILALIGLLFVIAVVYGIVQYGHYWNKIQSFDEQAMKVYTGLAQNLIDSGSIAAATVVRVKVAPDLTADDVDEVIRFDQTRNVTSHGPARTRRFFVGLCRHFKQGFSSVLLQ